METVQHEDSPPPLDPSLAPVLFFDAGEEATSLYSIPKKRALPAPRGFVADVPRAWVTPQGWVLTLDPASRAASLRDPFSSRTVDLPPDRGSLLDGQSTTCTLSTRRAGDPACVVLVASVREPVLCYCRPGGDRWFRHEYQTETISADSGVAVEVMARLTAVGGRFLASLSLEKKVVTLEFSPEPTLTVAHVADSPWPVGCSLVESCEVESCGELFSVGFCYTYLGINKRMCRVKVDRLDWSSGSWVREAELGGNRVFFLSSSQFGASMAAHEVGSRLNCIIFTEDDDKGLYVHDIEQGTTKLHNPQWRSHYCGRVGQLPQLPPA